MTIRNTGRRGLFGLLCGAPLAAVAAGGARAEADALAPPDEIVVHTLELSGRWPLDFTIEAVERKLAGRMARGHGALGKAIEGTYGVRSIGR